MLSWFKYISREEISWKVFVVPNSIFLFCYLKTVWNIYKKILKFRFLRSDIQCILIKKYGLEKEAIEVTNRFSAMFFSGIQ